MFAESVTEWLVLWKNGDEEALQEITPLVYRELHRLAASYLSRERQGHTLQATALVHEAYLQISKLHKVDWQSRAHFVAIAARMMRRILVDHARSRRGPKRAGASEFVPLSEVHAPTTTPDPNLMALDEALEKLASIYPRQAQVVELRFFGGLTNQEIVEILTATRGPISSRTVERDWRFARAWLHNAMTS